MGIREVQERVSERIEKVPGRYVDGTLKAFRVAEGGRQSAIGNSVVVCVCVCLCVCVYMRSSVRAYVNILFYVCSHRGDIRQKQKHIIIIYTNFPTGL